MKPFAILAASAALSLLTACGERNDPPQPDPSKPVPETAIGRTMEKAMDKARAKLATENISLTDFRVNGDHKGVVITSDENGNDTRPKAEITPQGDLLIEGKKIAADARQHALLMQYRKQVEGVASAGMDIGVQGAELGMKAAGEAIKGIFIGNTDDVEQRVEAEAEKIKLSARKLCDQLPAMLETQTALAGAMPEFKPYATMDQGDIDECYKDNQSDDPQTRAQVQNEVRQEIRTAIRSGIRNGIRTAAQTATGGARTVPELPDNTDAAAEAEAASVEDAAKN